MKAGLAKTIPVPIRPFVRNVYRRLAGKAPIWSDAQYRALPALKCEIGYNRYGGYCVPASSRHRPACRAILAHEVWEPETIELIRRECQGGDVVHAGAFFGDFLPAISQALAPGATVWAFEPSLENYRCAKITTEINDFKNVNLLHKGLGAQPTAASIKTRDSKLGFLGGAAAIADDGDEAVEIVRIDDAMAGRAISVIQLDVEGYEEQAIIGALGTIERCRPLIIIEVLPGSDVSARVHQRIRPLGYRAAESVHDNVVFRP